MSLILGLLVLYDSCVHMHSLVHVLVQERFVFMDHDNFRYKEGVSYSLYWQKYCTCFSARYDSPYSLLLGLTICLYIVLFFLQETQKNLKDESIVCKEF